MYNLAILASTRGTDFQAILDEMKAGKMSGIQIACLLTNVNDCGAAEKARGAGIPVHFIDPAHKTREQFDREAMAALEPYRVDLLALIGYMRIIGSDMVARYQNRIINVHPSLLPKFAGGMNLDVHQAVLDSGEKETGMTIHVVTDQLDGGPVLCQKKVAVEPNDTAKTLKEKVQALEKKWYPAVIRQLAVGKIKS